MEDESTLEIGDTEEKFELRSQGGVRLTLGPKGLGAKGPGQMSFGHAWGEVESIDFFPAEAYERESRQTGAGEELGMAFMMVGTASLARLAVPRNIYWGGPFVRVTTRRGRYLYSCDDSPAFMAKVHQYRPDLSGEFHPIPQAQPLSIDPGIVDLPVYSWSQPATGGRWRVGMGIFLALFFAYAMWTQLERNHLFGAAQILLMLIAAMIFIYGPKTTASISHRGVHIRRWPKSQRVIGWEQIQGASESTGVEASMFMGGGQKRLGDFYGDPSFFLRTIAHGEERVACPEPERAIDLIRQWRQALGLEQDREENEKKAEHDSQR